MEQVLYYGGKIEARAGWDLIEAILIEDGRVQAMGKFEMVEALKDETAQLVDLKGKTIQPVGRQELSKEMGGGGQNQDEAFSVGELVRFEVVGS